MTAETTDAAPPPDQGSRGARRVVRPVVGALADGTPYYAPIGEVVSDGITVTCHLCGRSLKSARFSPRPGRKWITLLYRNWPTGIRLDQAAVSIGAVGSPRAARRPPTVSHQRWGLFTCPWPAVRGIRVVTDRSELRQVKNSPRYYTLTNRWGTKRGMTHCNTGVLASPARCGTTALVAVGLVQPHSRDLSTATSGNSSGEP
jgi:hypothetical protein